MSAEKAVYSVLAAATGVTNLVPASKIFPAGRRNQSVAAPAIVYFRDGGRRVYSLQGPSGYDKAHIRVDIFGRSFPEAKSIADAVETALSGYRGIIAGVNVQSILLMDDHDVIDQDEEVFVTEEFHRAMDFSVQYQY